MILASVFLFITMCDGIRHPVVTAPHDTVTPLSMDEIQFLSNIPENEKQRVRDLIEWRSRCNKLEWCLPPSLNCAATS